jgi:organic hydroperoxide reductase OsmC/OhrA
VELEFNLHSASVRRFEFSVFEKPLSQRFHKTQAMPIFTFEGTASWKSGLECELTIKGKHIATVSPPQELGGKQGYCVPEEVFAASLASCMNTLFIMIAKNSKLALEKAETEAAVKMSVEGLEKLIFTDIHFCQTVKLANDTDMERKKTKSVFNIAQKICPLRQSWGEKVPISFELNFE